MQKALLFFNCINIYLPLDSGPPVSWLAERDSEGGVGSFRKDGFESPQEQASGTRFVQGEASMKAKCYSL